MIKLYINDFIIFCLILWDFYKRKYNDFHDVLFNFEGEEEIAEQGDPESLQMLEDVWENFDINHRRGYFSKYDLLILIVLYLIIFVLFAYNRPPGAVEIDWFSVKDTFDPENPDYAHDPFDTHVPKRQIIPKSWIDAANKKK